MARSSKVGLFGFIGGGLIGLGMGAAISSFLDLEGPLLMIILAIGTAFAGFSAALQTAAHSNMTDRR